MDKEFEDYWNAHQRHLILNAPEKLRKEFMESSRLDSPVDWVCFVIPIAVGILLQPLLGFASEILSWGVVLLVVVILFVLLQMVRPYISRKKTEAQVVDEIKRFYYERYKKYGLDMMEPWQE